MTWLRDRRVWIVLALIAGVVALRLSPLGVYLSLDAVAQHRDALAAFVARNRVVAAVVYVAIYAAAVSVAMPGATVLTLTGGLLFGAVLGAGLTVAAATTGATLVFLFARRLFGADALDRLGPTAQQIAAGLRQEAVSYLLVLRLLPLFPFTLVNIVPAFAGVPLRVFALTTFVGIFPGTAVYSLAGAGLNDALATGGGFDIAQVLTPGMLGALAVLAAISLAAIPLRRRFVKD